MAKKSTQDTLHVCLTAQLDDGHELLPVGAVLELPRTRALRLVRLGMATVLELSTKEPRVYSPRKSKKTDDDTKAATPEDAGDDNPEDTDDAADSGNTDIPDPDSIPPDDDEE